MRSAFPTALLLVSLALLPTSDLVAREGKFFSAQINYVFADLEGSARTEGTLATEFDFEDTLGITDDDELPEANIWFNFGRNSIMLSYYKSNYDGEQRLTEALTFEDTTFPVSTDIRTEFDFALARLHYNFRFVDTKWIDLGFLVGADLYSGEGSVSDSSGLLQDDTDFNAPFPVVGVNLAIKPPFGLLIHLEASGIRLDVSDVDATALDAQARLTWYILDGPFGVSAGYRHLDIDIDVEDEGQGDLQQSGYYGGISLRF